MRDKKIVAMFIASIIAFVASLTISFGVANALADPVDAVGLAEISYVVSTQDSESRQIVFDPVAAYNGEAKDAVYVNSYENIQYANEILPDCVKLLKIKVTNNTDFSANFRFNVQATGESNAVKYVKFAIFNAVSGELHTPDSVLGSTLPSVNVQANAEGYFVLAVFVNDASALEIVDFSSSMTLFVSITEYNNYQ